MGEHRAMANVPQMKEGRHDRDAVFNIFAFHCACGCRATSVAHVSPKELKPAQRKRKLIVCRAPQTKWNWSVPGDRSGSSSSALA